jgi:glutamate-1-semialdehyde 2,1-aminomutase
MATINTYKTEPVIEHLYHAGDRLRTGIGQAVSRHGLEAQVPLMGRSSCLLFGLRDAEGQPSQALRTLFLQETIRRGVIMPSLVVSYSHSGADIDHTIEAVDGALQIYVQALNDGVEKYLIGRPSQVVQRRYNVAE